MTTFPTDFINGNSFVYIDDYRLRERPLSELTPKVALEILRKTKWALNESFYYYGSLRSIFLKLEESVFNYYVEKAEFTDLNTSGLYTSVLCEAVEKGYKTGLQILLNRKVDFYLNKALNDAVREGKKDLVELFINANVNLDCHHDDRTALRVAIEMNNSPLQLVNRLDIVKLLTRAGADIDFVYESNLGIWPIYTTADKAIVEHLINLGAKVNNKTRWGHDVLHLAVEYRREDIAAVLLNEGATL